MPVCARLHGSFRCFGRLVVIVSVPGHSFESPLKASPHPQFRPDRRQIHHVQVKDVQSDNSHIILIFEPLNLPANMFMHPSISSISSSTLRHIKLLLLASSGLMFSQTAAYLYTCPPLGTLPSTSWVVAYGPTDKGGPKPCRMIPSNTIPQLVSTYGNAKMFFQTDGNVVVYLNGTLIWASSSPDQKTTDGTPMASNPTASWDNGTKGPCTLHSAPTPCQGLPWFDLTSDGALSVGCMW